ncbi:MAG: hypothetical protein JWM61_1623, partial [Micrococcaceae bacterium]|nr:hypothetical protein [Micrococcaceae bacterium]
NEIAGRFDLHATQGTCYLATDVQTAIRERLGKRINKANLVGEGFVAEMEVVTLNLPYCANLADTGDEAAADMGAIRELGAGTYKDYAKTARWAAAFSSAGFNGILYGSRFTSISESTAIALFDKEADKAWDEGTRLSGDKSFAVANMSHLIKRPPASTAPTVVRSPAPAPLPPSA